MALPSQGPPGFDVVAIDSHSQPGTFYEVRHLSPTDLNDNAVRDFVHQTPGNPEAPDYVHCAIDPSFLDAAALARLSSSAATGYPGAVGLYATNGDGLVYATHSGLPWTWSQTVIAGGDWRDAISLEVFDVDGASQPDLLGITADRLGILLATDSGTGIQASSQRITTTTGLIDDVIADRYDQSRTAMIVASTSAGLECFWVSGGSITTLGASNADGRLAVLREDGLADRFAWLRNEGAGRQLEVFTLPFTPDSTLMLEDWAQSMASGTYDDDLLDDLIFGGGPVDAGERPVQVKILKQTATRMFSTVGDSQRHHTFATSGGDLEFEPFMGDADGDGDNDVVVAAPDGTLYLALNDDIPLDDVAPRILETEPNPGSMRVQHAWVTVPSSIPDDYTLHLRIEPTQTLPTIVKDGVSIPATHIEWFVWDSQQQPGSGGLEFQTQSTPIQQGYCNLEGDSLIVMDHPSLPGRSFYYITCTIFDGASYIADIRYITLRYVAFDGQGKSLVRWPARQYFLVSEDHSAASNYLPGLSFVDFDNSAPLQDMDPLTINLGDGGGGGGALGGTGCCPDYEDDCIPAGPPPPPPAD